MIVCQIPLIASQAMAPISPSAPQATAAPLASQATAPIPPLAS